MARKSYEVGEGCDLKEKFFGLLLRGFVSAGRACVLASLWHPARWSV